MIRQPETMDLAAFFVLLRKRAASSAAVGDPLKAAQKFIDNNGNTGEGRALLRVVTALYKGEGEFLESDLYSFGTETLSLVPALIDARLEARYPEWRWHRASSYPAWRFLLDLQKRYNIK